MYFAVCDYVSIYFTLLNAMRYALLVLICLLILTYFECLLKDYIWKQSIIHIKIYDFSFPSL